MSNALLQRLERRLRLLREEHEDLSWKSPEALQDEWQRGESGGQPGPAYDALRHTAGPATDNPTWVSSSPDRREAWTSPNGHTYMHGEPAPRWTPKEIHAAMHAQIMIWARGEGRHAFAKGHGARVDPNWVYDLAQNGHGELQRILTQELDEGRSLKGGGFVSYITRRVKEAMGKGLGGNNDIRNAMGRVGDLLRSKDADAADAVAAKVGYKYRTERSHVSSRRDPGNAYGEFTPDVYALAMELGDAFRAQDPDAVAAAKAGLKELDASIRDAMTSVQGTDTGRRIISTPHGAKDDSEAKKDRDRFFQTKIGSMDAPLGSDSDATVAASVYQDRRDDYRGGPDLSGMDPSVLYEVLKLARQTSAGSQTPAVMRYLKDSGVEPITTGDYRYLIRLLSEWLPNGEYPGKGTDSDPEIVNGAPSKWVQEGQPHMMDSAAILRDLRSGVSGGEEVLDRVQPGARPLSEMEREVLAYLLGLHPSSKGQPLSQARVAAIWPNPKAADGSGKGISKVRVSQVVTKGIVPKMGKTIAELLDEVQSGGVDGAAPDPDSQPSKDPLGKFQGWMRLYQSENEDLDEGYSPEANIVFECARAVNRLYYWTVVSPVLSN